MKELELLLAILPREVVYKGKKYSLFIYPGIQGGWTVEYAMGRFYCDANNGCADDDYYTLYGCESHTLKEAIDVMMRWLKKNIGDEEKDKSTKNIKQKESCGCACHENQLQKPYSHSSVCCDIMNGYVEEKKQEPKKGESWRRGYQTGIKEGRIEERERIEKIGAESHSTFPVGFWEEVRKLN